MATYGEALEGGGSLGYTPTSNRIAFGGSTPGTLTDSNNLRFSDSAVSLGVGAAPATGIHLHVGAADATIALDATSGNAVIEWRKAGTMVMRSRTGTTNHVWEPATNRTTEHRVSGSGEHSFQTAAGENLRIKANGDVVIGDGDTAASVIATTSAVEHFRLPTCAGVPTGAAVDGALILDNTNGKVYARTAGAWVALN